jgi:UDP-sulfoquinovose synthase
MKPETDPLKVKKAAGALGLDVEVNNLENPRDEMEEHYYRPDHQHLFDLGYKPTHDVEAEMGIMLRDLIKYRERIEAKRDVLIPDVRWNGRREKVRFLHPHVTATAPRDRALDQVPELA